MVESFAINTQSEIRQNYITKILKHEYMPSVISQGHIGLSNEKKEEIASGDFTTALPYLKIDEHQAKFVIHVYSSTYDLSPYMQRSNIRSNGRKIFLERLGFSFSNTCNVLGVGKCYYKEVEIINRDRLNTYDLMEEQRVIGPIYNRYHKFANNLGEIFERMHGTDQLLVDSGFELPWENLKTSPIIVSKDEKVYEKGHLYDFYHDILEITQKAKVEVLLVDAYADEESINLYFDKLPSPVKMGILTNTPQGNFLTVAKKFKMKPNVNFEVRRHNDCHDRLYFVDNSCWVIGQSIKDAAKKPTYLVRIESADLFKNVFKDLWDKGQVLI